MAIDLDKNPIIVTESVPKMAQLLDVSVELIYNRLERRITKYGHGVDNKYKFNVVKLNKKPGFILKPII